MRRGFALGAVLAALGVAACAAGERGDSARIHSDGGSEDAGVAPPNEGRPDASEGARSVRVTHGAGAPLISAAGGVAFVEDDLAVASTATGIIAFATRGPSAGVAPAGFVEWALDSSRTGAAAPFLAAAPSGAMSGGRHVFFNPAGRPQVGVLVVGEAGAQGALLSEAALGEDLSSGFPSALVAPLEGPASDALWIADVSFTAPNSVRAYRYAGWDAANRRLAEDRARRFAPAPEDFDGDGRADPVVFGSLRFVEGGRVGLVTFTFLALGGASGGVYAFDAAAGFLLGRVVVPFEGEVEGSLAFVGGADATDDRLVVAVAEKGPGFEDIGGRAAIYRALGWSPFAVEDADPSSPFDDPSSWVEAGAPNAVGVLAAGDLALVLSAPLSMDGALSAISLPAAEIAGISPLGRLFVEGASIPSGPWISPDGREVLIGAEAGVLRAELVED